MRKYFLILSILFFFGFCAKKQQKFCEFRHCTMLLVDRDKKSNEGIGFAPNVFILNTPQAQAEGRDLMMEKAIEELKKK